MNSRARSITLGSFFALLSVASGGFAYYCIEIGKVAAAVVRAFIVKARNPAIAADEWFLIVLSLTCGVAAIAFFARRKWAIGPAVAALIAIGLWAIVMMVVPENRTPIYLSIRFDPLGDVVLLAVAIAGLLATFWKKSAVTTGRLSEQ